MPRQCYLNLKPIEWNSDHIFSLDAEIAPFIYNLVIGEIKKSAKSRGLKMPTLLMPIQIFTLKRGSDDQC
jgi:hypothetical protein